MRIDKGFFMLLSEITDPSFGKIGKHLWSGYVLNLLSCGENRPPEEDEWRTTVKE